MSNAITSKPTKAREVFDRLNDLPHIDDILDKLYLHFDNMIHKADDGNWDISEWWFVSPCISFMREGKPRAAKTMAPMTPDQVLDLVIGEITRRMGGCPCDKRLEAWKVWNAEKGST